MRWLAYLHPLAMLCVLGLGIWALRQGLRLRHARVRAARARPPRASHTRPARAFVVLVSLGYLSGLGSMAWLRAEAVYGSPHALLTSLSLAALLTTGTLGLLLERGSRRRLAVRRTAHLALGGAGLLLALAAAVAGLDILP